MGFLHNSTSPSKTLRITAGGTVTDLQGQTLRYGKPGFENPHFVAWGQR